MGVRVLCLLRKAKWKDEAIMRENLTRSLLLLGLISLALGIEHAHYRSQSYALFAVAAVFLLGYWFRVRKRS